MSSITESLQVTENTNIVHVSASTLTSTACSSCSAMQIYNQVAHSPKRTIGNFCVAGSAGMRGLQSNFWSLEVVWIAAAPQLAAKLLAPCDLQQADYVLVKVMLSM